MEVNSHHIEGDGKKFTRAQTNILNFPQQRRKRDKGRRRVGEDQSDDLNPGSVLKGQTRKRAKRTFRF